ncbi:MAG: GNVR domain-containing protein, partial [Bacteroidota bacterium]
MEDLQVQSKNELASLSVRDLFFKYIRFLPLFIISVALALFVVFVYLRYATLIYRSTGTMVIRDEPSSGSGDKFEQIFASDGKKNIQNEIEFLQSRPLMERVVDKLNLNFTYLAKGKIKELNIYRSAPFTMEVLQLFDSTASFSLPFLFTTNNKFRFVGETTEISFGQVFKNEYGVFKMTRKSNVQVTNNEYHLIWEPSAVVAANLLQNLVIAPKQNTGILVLTMEGTNPMLTADVVNGLMEVYDKATVEDKNTTTRQTVEFIDARIAEVTRGLDSVTNRKLAFQQANNLISPEAQSNNYLSRLEETDKEVTIQRMQLNTAEMIDNYVRNRRFDATPTPSSLGLDDPTLNELVTGYNKAQLERKALLENAPPGNVAVKQKDEEIEELRTKISENLGNIKSAYRQSMGSIEGKNASVLSQVKTLPAKQQILIEMEREQQSKLRVFNLLNEKREESAIKIAATISNTKVLTNAGADMTPVKPNRRNAQILAALIGLVLPGLFIFGIELLNDKVSTRNDIERITSAPIIAEVGHSYADKDMVVTQNSRSVVAEQFRILRSNLQYVLANISKPVVLITSSFSGEGKSFVSTNIGSV